MNNLFLAINSIKQFTNGFKSNAVINQLVLCLSFTCIEEQVIHDRKAIVINDNFIKVLMNEVKN